MSRELALLAKEFDRTAAIVLRTEMNLYQTTIHSVSAAFLRKVDQESKKMKTATVTLVAIIKSK
jgi:hypothetical protein